MKVLSIFIASSFELSCDRIAIGDIILRIAEKKLLSENTYVRMLCWEDYDPTYVGIPTQQGYDEDLIKKSQVIIALFKTRCGKYTQGELDLGKALGIPIEYLQRSTKEPLSVDLENYLKDNSLSTCLYENVSELERLISDIIFKYIDKGVENVDIPLPIYKLGAIVQCGASFELNNAKDFVSSQSFNNIIRQLNEIVFEQKCGRIALLESYDANKCDTLVACFHDQVDVGSESILDEAADHIKAKDSELRRLNIFFYQEGNTHLPGVQAYSKKLMDDVSWQYFPVSYKSQDTVKMYLFRLLISNALSFDFSLNGFVLQYNSLPIADIRKLPFVENGMKEVEGLCNKIDVVKGKEKSPDNILQLDELHKRLRTKVLFALNSWVEEGKLALEELDEENKLLAELYNEKRYDEIIDSTKAKEVFTHIRESEVAQEVVENRKNVLMQDIVTIEYRIKALQEKEYSVENTEDIVACYDKIVDIFRHLSKNSTEYRRMLLHQCNALCLIADNGFVISDYDRFYEYQIEILESDETLMQEVTFNGYLTLEANLLNGYNRNQKWSDGDRLVGKINKHLESFGDKETSEELLKLMVRVMNAIVGYYGNKGNIERASSYQIKAESYQDKLIEINSKHYLSGKLTTITNCLLNHFFLNEHEELEKYIIEGDQLIEEVDSHNYYVGDMWFGDKTVYYRTVSSLYYECDDIRNKEKSEHYFKLGFDAVEHFKDSNPGTYWEKKSELYQNHAFMLAHFHDFEDDNGVTAKIIEDYESALSLRKMLTKHNKTFGTDCAQTMVNIGDIYRILQQYDKAERYASEAKSIYEQFLDENVILTMDHFNQAHLLYVTILRDKAFHERNIREFNSMMEEMDKLKTWAIEHEEEIVYYDTIMGEVSISEEMKEALVSVQK